MFDDSFVPTTILPAHPLGAVRQSISIILVLQKREAEMGFRFSEWYEHSNTLRSLEIYDLRHDSVLVAFGVVWVALCGCRSQHKFTV